MSPSPGHCEACGRPVGRKDRICTGCGQNLRTGQRTATKRGEDVRGTNPLLWIWENLLGMFGCLVVTVAIAGVFFALARGDRDLTGFYMLAVTVATGITVLLIVIAIVQSEGWLGLFASSEAWFWWSDSTDGRLKGVLIGLIIAGALILPLRASLPRSGHPGRGLGSALTTHITPARPPSPTCPSASRPG